MAKRFYSAGEVTDVLGITAATLYAYVSRGFIRSEAIPGERRSRRYRAEDVERLRERVQLRRDPARAAREALQWGEPVLESSIALIDAGRLYYRGQDAAQLATNATVEDVASLIWSSAAGSAFTFAADRLPLPRQWASIERSASSVSNIERAQIALTLAESIDPAPFDLRRAAIEASGIRIVQTLVAVATSGSVIVDGVAATLARAWTRGSRRDRDLISAALILAADHELNVSAFTVRCVASAGSTVYAAVSAGLGALRGTRHGGYTERVERMVGDVERDGSVESIVSSILRTGESIPGFGHPLYPNGDPRGALLLSLAVQSNAKSRALKPVLTLAAHMRKINGEGPTIDLGLVAVSRVLGLPAHSAIALFAIGRSIGWIGHAIEQYASERIIRPRASYVGVIPE